MIGAAEKHSTLFNLESIGPVSKRSRPERQVRSVCLVNLLIELFSVRWAEVRCFQLGSNKGSVGQISIQSERSRNVIDRFLRNPAQYWPKCSERCRSFPPEDRQIVRVMFRRRPACSECTRVVLERCRENYLLLHTTEIFSILNLISHHV